MKPTIVLLTTNLARGGAEAQVALLARALRGRGWPVEVISMREPSWFAGELESDGIPVHSLGMIAGRVNAAGLARLAGLIRRLRPEIVHSHMFHANILARMCRLIFPIPRLIGTLHSIAESPQSHGGGVKARDRLYGITDRLGDVTVAVAEAVAARHIEAGAVSPRRIRVIPNGVDTGRFHPDPAARARLRAELEVGSEFLWLAAGRLIWKKDYPTLIDAIGRLRGGVLCVAGAGPLEEHLQTQARDLGSRVRFLGARDDLPQLMSAADGFVLSSIVEGMPMVLIEAAASGLPCVATRAGGAEEVVLEGETGYLAPIGDAQALAAAMARLAKLPAASRSAMASAARKRAVKRFDIRRIADRWEALYLES